MDKRFQMDKADQILVVTDKKGTITEFDTRLNCHKGRGKTHWAILAVIKRPHGKIIVAKRSKFKSVFKNIWDVSIATHVLKGETPEYAALRASQKELGITPRFQIIDSFYYHAQDKDFCEREFCNILIGQSGDKLKINKSEISEVKEMNPADLLKTIQETPEIYSFWSRKALNRKNLLSAINSK